MAEDEKTYYTNEEWKAFTIEHRHEIEKNQLFGYLAEAGIEAAEFFLKRVEEGKIEGGDYWDDEAECGCVLGTLKFATDGAEEASLTDTESWKSTKFCAAMRDWEDAEGSLSVVEVLAYNLSPGDTPKNNENARLLYDWTKEWLDSQRVASQTNSKANKQKDDTMDIVQNEGVISIPIKQTLDGRVERYLNVWRGVGSVGFASTLGLPTSKAFGIQTGVNKDSDMIGGLLIEEIPQFIEIIQTLAASPAPKVPEELRALFSDKELEIIDSSN